MLRDVLIEIYERDLKKLGEEISLYAVEEELWITSGEIANSAGNLCSHIIGNLQHFIGAVLGGSGYVRHRDEEFSLKGIRREAMLADIQWTLNVVKATIAELPQDSFQETYPIEVFGHPMTTEYFLVHLATHLNYHLGQINYHRRLLGS